MIHSTNVKKLVSKTVDLIETELKQDRNLFRNGINGLSYQEKIEMKKIILNFLAEYKREYKK